ncbi:MAG: potassium transporter TrkG, partial [Desulfobacterales bacterium]
MRWRYISHILGILILFLGLTMILPLLVGFTYGDRSVLPLLKSMGITLLVGGVLTLVFRREQAEVISQRESMAIVTFGWVAVGVLGALPFYLSGEFGSFTDAFFESMSGFTTTGASILTNIEAVSNGLLFWRSFIQWLGGMGIIVLSLA